MTTVPSTASVASALPRHVGIIMDGNGRWATARGLDRVAGHRVGAESVRDVVRASRQLGLGALTLYAFSSQNWGRPAAEVGALMELLREFVLGERAEILDNQIRLEAIGDAARLPSHVREPLDELRAASAGNTGMTLTLALSYGGRESIAAAVRQVAADVAAGRVAPRRDRRGDVRSLPADPRAAAARPAHPHLGRAAGVELHVVGDRLRRADLRRRGLARLPAAAAVPVPGGVRARRERRYGLTGAQVAAPT
jgi:undecaprenyl diphosphate synthase